MHFLERIELSLLTERPQIQQEQLDSLDITTSSLPQLATSPIASQAVSNHPNVFFNQIQVGSQAVGLVCTLAMFENTHVI